ncbi:MAG: SCO family protein [Bacillus sp. (in: firmicutes)]
MKKIYITFVTLLVLGIGSGIYYFTAYKQSKMILPENLVLQTYEGRDFSFNEMPPKVRLIEFMYTQCPDICPNTTHTMRQLQNELIEQGVFEDKVEFVTVTFDPTNDTEEVLSNYAESFEMNKTDGWHLLTGAKEDIRELANTFEFQFRNPGTGEFVHTSATYLLDENNRVIEIFGMGQKDFIKEDVYKKIMKNI